MPLIVFKMKVDVDRSFRREMTEMASALSRWAKAPISGAAAAFIKIQDHHKALYDSGGAGGSRQGGPWAALRARTIRARRMRTRCSRLAPRDYAGAQAGNKILFWSGRLRSSLTGEALAGSNYGDAVRQVTAHSLTFGTKTPTASMLRAGRFGRNPMPVRDPIDDVAGPLVGIDAIEARILSFLRGDEYAWGVAGYPVW